MKQESTKEISGLQQLRINTTLDYLKTVKTSNEDILALKRCCAAGPNGEICGRNKCNGCSLEDCTGPITQAMLAEALNYDENYISKFECGKRALTSKAKVAYVKFFGEELFNKYVKKQSPTQQPKEITPPNDSEETTPIKDDINYYLDSKYAIILRNGQASVIDNYMNFNKGLYCLIGVSGDLPIYCDLANSASHLIVGAMGTGKTNLINTILLSLVSEYSPNDLKIKLFCNSYELYDYTYTPSFSKNSFVINGEKAFEVLSEIVEEMELRYKKFDEFTCPNITAYNYNAQQNETTPMEHIVIIMDGFTRFACNDDIQHLLFKILSCGRAAGIHLILSTDDLLDDDIDKYKTYCPNVIAFQLLNKYDSEYFIETADATNLKVGEIIYKNDAMPALRKCKVPRFTLDIPKYFH